jgi:DNA-binding NtrC family response regulator
MTRLRILHLDDNPFELDRVKVALEKNPVETNFLVESVLDAESFRKRLLHSADFDVALLDVHLDEGYEVGIELAAYTRTLYPNLVTIMFSELEDVSSITQCLRTGADDFLSKRSDKAELSLRIWNSYRLASLKRGINKSTDLSTASELLPAGVAGETMKRIALRIPRIIESAIAAVHVEGESGTGKEVVADLFPKHLPPHVPFVKVNCGAIAPSLLESELFGHAKGAFTGASAHKIGYLEASNEGWLFLDEVSSLTLQAQTALLRAIENQEIIRVGDNTPRKINVRIVSATNEPLEELVLQGRFRKDLWQRLTETEIHLPPLRMRPDEIREIALYFCEKMAGGPYLLTLPTLEILTKAAWQSGNIRELRNCLRAMTEYHVGKVLTPLSLPERILTKLSLPAESISGSLPTVKLAEHPGFHECEQEKDERAITLNIRPGEFQFEIYSEELLAALFRHLIKIEKRPSLRRIARQLGFAHSTLSSRLKKLVENKCLTPEEISIFTD